ncbi:hypothetical protein OVS_00215 [Mycoplasma ovis str. Michigan]|uniref:Uncharacterized protein n=1 Tax=Mycoplasma ovis str. Michigan TaxID=1415773 RepID=A0ABM5P148_9MOLU|nr:hypothetical protein [Mycoplasma ovis]AHC40083.1 hypothetical protein OVS_00215 [Mycoplasma ovis str. Michigan]
MVDIISEFPVPKEFQLEINQGIPPQPPPTPANKVRALALKDIVRKS